MIARILLGIVLAGLLLVGLVWMTGTVRAAAPAGQEALVSSAARTLGVRRCLPAISAVAQRAVTGATMQDIMVDWDRTAPDGAPFFSFTGLGAGSERAGLSLSAIPSATGGCAILVERISATARACRDVAASELPGFVGQPLIDGIMVYRNPAQSGETYALIATSGGCLVMRRQAAFKWPPAR